MKVLLNALGANTGGAMRHLTNFLPHLAQLDLSNQYVCLVRSGFPELALNGSVTLQRVRDSLVRNGAARLLYDIVAVPARLRRERFDAVVSLTNFGPVWSPVPHILFQRNSIYYCPFYESRATNRERIAAGVRRALAQAMMAKAHTIVVPSRAMASMIAAAIPRLRSRRFQTLYHGFDYESLSAASPALQQQLASHSGKVRLVYPTHSAPHKGFEVLFDVIRSLRERLPQLALFLTLSDDHVKEMAYYRKPAKSDDLAQQIVCLGTVPRGEMGALYGSSDVMIYPSLCESFGFSMIEAMGYGLPIVAADTEINREICGDAALYYPATDSSLACEAVLEALQPATRSHLLQAAAARLRSFDWSWRRNATEFVAVVNTVSQHSFQAH